MHSQEFIQKMKARLEKEKEEVLAEIKKDSAPEIPQDNPDMDDLGQDATEDILEEALMDTHENILERVENAISKINNGTYGICEECGTDIPEDVLTQVPWAEHCNKCEK